MRANQRTLIGLGAALLLAVGACASEGAIPPVEQTTFERLQQRTVLTFDTDVTTVGLVTRLNRGGDWVEGKARLPLRRGYVSLGATGDGVVSVHGMEMWLDDVVLTPGQFASNGLHLTNLILRLDEQAVCDHAQWSDDDDAVTATLAFALSYDWAVVIDGTTYQLGTQRLAAASAEAIVLRRDGKLIVEMEIRSDGTVWDWAGLIELEDLTIIAKGVDEPWVL